jgi:alkanesulfonate monooxygenase SsuD/methylene tetrahydromethanopterin reductase-like flavin-dependent oxidoreductase (luciferase family)
MDMVRKGLVFGDADSVGEQLQQAVALGLDGITVDLPVNGHNLERVELLGKIAQKALG